MVLFLHLEKISKDMNNIKIKIEGLLKKMTKCNLSIVIPCYNEEKNLPLLVESIKELIEKNKKIALEVVLVDNGSKDNSKNILKTYENLDGIKICYVDTNIGYGNGILQGLKLATGDILSWTHADLQTDLDDVITAYNLYISHANKKLIVKGKRKNRNLLDNFFTLGMQFVVMLLLKANINDVNAQPKLFSKEFYNEILSEKAPLDFSLDLFLLYWAIKKNYETATVDVIFNKRLYGEAKGGGSLKTKFKLIIRTFKYIWLLKKELKN